jgi:hypothetical protein
MINIHMSWFRHKPPKYPPIPDPKDEPKRIT